MTDASAFSSTIVVGIIVPSYGGGMVGCGGGNIGGVTGGEMEP
jgi:hypothetical protein